MAKFPYLHQTPKRLVKLSKKEQEDLVFDLINAFALVKNPLHASLLLQDLLTASEIKNLSKRLRIAKLLIEGWRQDQIVTQLHCSFGTIAKVKAWLDEAGEGLQYIIKRLPKRRKGHQFKKDALGYIGLPQIIIGTYLNSLKKKDKQLIKSFMEKKDKKARIYSELQKIIDEEYRRVRLSARPKLVKKQKK